MMHLGLMKRFFDTVDGEWRSPVAAQIASAWVGPDGDVRILRASANFVCVVKTAERKLFCGSTMPMSALLRLWPASWHLSATYPGAACALPCRCLPAPENWSKASRPNMGLFHAVLFEALPGVHLEFDQLDRAGF